MKAEHWPPLFECDHVPTQSLRPYLLHCLSHSFTVDKGQGNGQMDFLLLNPSLSTPSPFPYVRISKMISVFQNVATHLSSESVFLVKETQVLSTQTSWDFISTLLTLWPPDTPPLPTASHHPEQHLSSQPCERKQSFTNFLFPFCEAVFSLAFNPCFFFFSKYFIAIQPLEAVYCVKFTVRFVFLFLHTNLSQSWSCPLLRIL